MRRVWWHFCVAIANSTRNECGMGRKRLWKRALHRHRADWTVFSKCFRVLRPRNGNWKTSKRNRRRKPKPATHRNAEVEEESRAHNVIGSYYHTAHRPFSIFRLLSFCEHFVILILWTNKLLMEPAVLFVCLDLMNVKGKGDSGELTFSVRILFRLLFWTIVVWLISHTHMTWQTGQLSRVPGFTSLKRTFV